jgi:hypothetical protein
MVGALADYVFACYTEAGEPLFRRELVELKEDQGRQWPLY